MKTKLFLGLAACAGLMFGSAFAADTGESLYKENCAKCHAAEKMAAIAKMMKFENTDPLDLTKSKATVADIEAAITKGKGKMKAINAEKVDAAKAKMIAEYAVTLQKK